MYHGFKNNQTLRCRMNKLSSLFNRPLLYYIRSLLKIIIHSSWSVNCIHFMKVSPDDV